MAIDSLRISIYALTLFLLASCATEPSTAPVAVGTILQDPSQFEGQQLAVAGCLIRVPVPGWNYNLVLLAPSCSFVAGSDLRPLAAHVLDVTVSDTGNDSGLKPGEIVLSATFKRYGRGKDSINFNLHGVSTTGELVVESK